MFANHENVIAKEAGAGMTRKVLVYSEQLMVCEMNLSKGAVVPEHIHPHEQSSYIVSGHCDFTVGDESYEAYSGDAVLIPGNVSHKVEVFEDSVIVDTFTPARGDFLE